jgi:hypothetical protein
MRLENRADFAKFGLSADAVAGIKATCARIYLCMIVVKEGKRDTAKWRLVSETVAYLCWNEFLEGSVHKIWIFDGFCRRKPLLLIPAPES